jgi:CelD/BcsL family acetyltransferase involved in cellulose biosynthesis
MKMDETLNSMLNLTLHTTLPEGLQDDWNNLLAESISHVPFLRYEYLRTWWETRGGGEWPDASLALVTAHENGRLVGAAPLFHSSLHPGGPALLNLGCIEISDYLDILARPDDLPRFLEALLPFLDEQKIPKWHALHLYNLLEDSPSPDAIKKAAEKFGWEFETERLQHSPYIPLPGDWEQYLSGIDKKQRHEIRRKMRRSEEAGIPVDWYIVEDAASLESEIDAFLKLMEFDPEKAKFLTPAMRDQMSATIRCAFQAGCLQLAFFQVNGAKAAAYLSFDYLNRLWVYNSGINPEFKDYSPGWVLLGYLLKWANDHGRAAFDFMRGNEDYKYRFGAVDRFVVRVSLKKGK